MSRTTTALCFMLSLFWFSGVISAQTEGNPKYQTLDKEPLRAEEAMTSGTPGVDYNLADDQGFRHGPWIRYYSDGSLYYSGWFEHGLPVGSWWYFNKEGFAEMHVVHRDNPSVRRSSLLQRRAGRCRRNLHAPRIGIEKRVNWSKS